MEEEKHLPYLVMVVLHTGVVAKDGSSVIMVVEKVASQYNEYPAVFQQAIQTRIQNT